MPVRLFAWAIGPSTMLLPSTLGDVKVSTAVMLPVLVMTLLVPAATSIPIALSADPCAIVPALLTALLLSMVTAAPPLTVIEPVLVMLMSEAAPLLAFDVLTGAVVAVLIETWAARWPGTRRRAIGVRQVVDFKMRIC